MNFSFVAGVRPTPTRNKEIVILYESGSGDEDLKEEDLYPGIGSRRAA